MKTVAGAMVALIFCLVLTRDGTHFSLLLSLLACCLITLIGVQFLEPVVDFFHTLEDMIPLDSDLLQIVLKVTGIGLVGELGAMICVDGGNTALGKSLQTLTSILILWLSLPLLRSLMDLVSQILEAI